MNRAIAYPDLSYLLYIADSNAMTTTLIWKAKRANCIREPCEMSKVIRRSGLSQTAFFPSVYALGRGLNITHTVRNFERRAVILDQVFSSGAK